MIHHRPSSSTAKVDTARHRRLGVTALLLAIAAVAVAFSYSNLISQDTRLRAHFDSVEGLRPGTEVVVSGYPVGYIENIRAVDSRLQLFEVRIRLNRDVELPSDSVIAVAQGSLFEAFRLVIRPGVRRPILQDGATITVVPAEPSMMDRLGEIAPRINHVMAGVEALVTQANSTLGSVQTAVLSIQETVGSLRVAVDRIVAVIGDPAAPNRESGATVAVLMEQVRQAVASTETAVVDLSRELAAVKFGDRIAGVADQAQETAEAWAGTAARLDGLSDRMGRVAQSADAMITRNAMAFDRSMADSSALIHALSTDLPALVTQLRSIAGNLTQVSQDLRRDPSRILFGRPTEGTR